jgi:hypothetical protein
MPYSPRQTHARAALDSRELRGEPGTERRRIVQEEPALNGDLPEVLIERRHDARFGFRQVQKDDVFPSESLIGEEADLR